MPSHTISLSSAIIGMDMEIGDLPFQITLIDYSPCEKTPEAY
jgi:hypothetical protein